MDHKNTCPLCGDPLIYDGGYIQCQDPACGWNKPINFYTNKYVFRSNVGREYFLIRKEKDPKITVI